MSRKQYRVRFLKELDQKHKHASTVNDILRYDIALSELYSNQDDRLYALNTHMLTTSEQFANFAMCINSQQKDAHVDWSNTELLKHFKIDCNVFRLN